MRRYLDRALHNGVLGTQRGTQPGAMLYMLPLGAGVRKGGGNHGYSNGESHFWCCMGSAIEAFTRLHSSVFYRTSSTATQQKAYALPVAHLSPAHPPALTEPASPTYYLTGTAPLLAGIAPLSVQGGRVSRRRLQRCRRCSRSSTCCS